MLNRTQIRRTQLTSPLGRLLLLVTALGLAGAGGCRPGHRAEPADHTKQGWTWYRSGDFGPAIKAFEAALARAGTNTVQQQQALYGLGCTWNLRRPGEDPEKAAAYFHKVIATDPKSDLAAWSSLALARMQTLPVAGEAVDIQKQVQAYQVVIDAFPSSPAAEEAFVFQQAARLSDSRAGEEQAVLAALESFIKAHPQTPWRSSIFQLIAHCCSVLGRTGQQVEAIREEWKAKEAAAPAGTLPDRRLLYWRVATLAEFELGDFDLARENYRKIVAEYPTEQFVFLCKQELKRMDALEEKIRGQEAAK